MLHGDSKIQLKEAVEIVMEFDEDDDGSLNIEEFIKAMTSGAHADTVSSALWKERMNMKRELKEAVLKVLKRQEVDVEGLVAQAKKLDMPERSYMSLVKFHQAMATENASKADKDNPRGSDGRLPGRPTTTTLNVQTLTGKSIAVPVDPTVDTVADVCAAIGAMENIPVDACRLVWSGFQITDLPRFGGTLESIRAFGIDKTGRLVGDRFTKTDLAIEFGPNGHVIHLITRSM